MADKLFDINKLRSLLNKLLRSAGNILDGYSVSDADIEEKDGQVSASYVYTPTVGGNKVNLNVKISATNIKDIFSEVAYVIKNLTLKSIKEDNYSLKVLIGDYDVAKDDNQELLNNISLAAVEARGEGLLGVNFETASLDDIGIWNEYAFNKLIYDLTCSTDDDNIDVGVVKNQQLTNCIGWIHRYIDFLHKAVGESEGQLSHAEKENRAKDKESQISSTDATDAYNLVKGILQTIQGELKKLYQDRLNTELSLDELIPQDNEEEQSNTEENQTEGDEENPMEKEAATGSKHIRVTLQKVTASDDIDMLALSSDYLPGDTLDYIEDIINQPEFYDTVTETPTSYSVCVDDDGYDIEPCEECTECNPCESLCEVFKSGIRAYRNLYILHWMSSGNDMMKLHNLSEEMYGELQSEIDTIGELLVEKQGTVPQLDFPCDYIPVQKYEFQTGLDQIKSLIQMYIDCIDYAYCNQDSDVQSTLDEWLRYWNKQLNYFVKNQEM